MARVRGIIKEDLGQGGKYISNTGIHAVDFVRLGINVNKTGSKSLILVVQKDGDKFPTSLYLGVYEKADGTDGYEANRILDPLMLFCDAQSVDEGEMTIDFKGKDKVIPVLTGLKPMELNIAIQEKLNTYNSKIQPEVVGLFNKDGFSASELEAGAKAAQLDKVAAKLDYSIRAEPKKDVADAKAAIQAEADDVFN